MQAEKRKLAAAFASVITVSILLLTLIQQVGAVTFQRGSSGDTVTAIQQKLSAWGYYNGAIDGIYGSRTEAAVRYFQQKNGLAVD